MPTVAQPQMDISQFENLNERDIARLKNISASADLIQDVERIVEAKKQGKPLPARKPKAKKSVLARIFDSLAG